MSKRINTKLGGLKPSATDAGVSVHTSAAALLQAELDKAHRQLRSQQVQTDALIDSLGEGLVVIDPAGMISRVNAYALQALGFREAELVGHWYPKVVEVVDEHSRRVDPLSRPIAEALTEGKPVSEYTHFLRKDGSVMPVFLTVSPILIDNKPAGAIEIFRDLTKERELDLAKEDFVSLASHQLRTPVTGVKAILSMIHDGNFGEINDKQRRYLGMAITSSNRQLDIIEDLLSVARADAGTLDLDLDYVDIAQLVRESVREHEEEIRIRRQTLELEVPEQAQIVADGQKIQMVVDNLISNASKYTPHEGRIEVSMNVGATETRIRVKDTGVGIPAHQIDTAFAKFGRIENSLTAPAAGTGLGLYLAKKVINLHNGDIELTSSPGEGSVFEVVLPNKH